MLRKIGHSTLFNVTDLECLLTPLQLGIPNDRFSYDIIQCGPSEEQYLHILKNN
jgi:hypothetical protein